MALTTIIMLRDQLSIFMFVPIKNIKCQLKLMSADYTAYINSLLIYTYIHAA